MSGGRATFRPPDASNYGEVFARVKEGRVATGMSEQDGWEREFDLAWADAAEHKEPSARARMLAARWRDNPPAPVPFRGDPAPVRPRRSSWLSTALVLTCVITLIVVLGYAQVRGGGY